MSGEAHDGLPTAAERTVSKRYCLPVAHAHGVTPCRQVTCTRTAAANTNRAITERRARCQQAARSRWGSEHLWRRWRRHVDGAELKVDRWVFRCCVAGQPAQQIGAATGKAIALPEAWHGLCGPSAGRSPQVCHRHAINILGNIRRCQIEQVDKRRHDIPESKGGI